MTAYDFSLVKNTSFAIDLTADTLNMGAIDASTVSVSTDTSGNLVLTVGSDSVTLQGASIGQLTTSNITFGSATTAAIWAVGDNDTGSTFDSTGNTLNLTNASLTGTAATQANSNHLVHGLGGGDTITVGNGNNVVFGGSGFADSTDGNDTITIGSGGNTVYGNAGNDSVTATTASAAGTTNSIFLGLNDDTLNAAAAHAGNFDVRGNTGADTLTFTGATGDITVFGGNDTVDSTDGNDTITLGVGSATVYGNSGNDTVTSGNVVANESVVLYGGAGNDNLTLSSATTVNLASTAQIFGGNADTDTITLTNFFGDVSVFGGLGIASPDDLADTITLGEGSSSVWSNAGNDTINLVGGINNNEAVVINTGAGNDTVNVTSALANAGGTAGDDADIAIFSNAGDDVFNLNNNGAAAIEYDFSIGDFAAGDVVNVTLDAGGAATVLTVSGGGSSLTLTDANGGSYVFQGYAGDLDQTNFVISDSTRLVTNFSGTAATLTGGTGTDQLVSGTSGDTLIVGDTDATFDNNIQGGGGDDTIQIAATNLENANAGNGTIAGGDGTDTVEITGTTAITALNDADFAGAANLNFEILKLNNVTGQTVVIGANADDTGLTTIDASALTGTNTLTVTATAFVADLTVTGGAGVDSVNRTGANQADTFSFGGGADVATLGGGNDSVDGGAGNDTFTFVPTDLSSTDTIDGGDGTGDAIAFSAASTAFSDAQFTNVTNVESLTLTDGENTFAIGTQMDEAGIITIDGSAFSGTNSLVISSNTSSENMSLSGGAGSDTLIGGTGNDTLTGGLSEGAAGAAGANILTGGTGTNHFVINSAAAADGTDITDFLAGTSNVLDFSLGTFTDFVGANTAEFFGTTAALNAVDLLNNGSDDQAIVVISDVGYTDAATAFAAIDGASAALNANDEMILVFFDSDNNYASVQVDLDLSNNFTGAIEVARITDLDSLADFQAAFTGSASSINEIALVA